jgi:hypothetical protein
MGSLATSAETMHKAADTMAQAVRDVHDQAGSTAGGASTPRISSPRLLPRLRQ